MNGQTQQYEIASHGKYHLYSFNNSYYLYDIERMNAFSVGQAMYFKLSKLSEDEIEKRIFTLKGLGGSKPTVFPKEVAQSLTYISLNVAQVCNLSCVYCYGVDGEYGTKGKMPEEIAFQSVDFLIKESKSAKDISIGFFGGEPLLNYPLIKKVVKYSRFKASSAGKKISFSITTNGTKFSEEINRYLNENNFSVIVSFDGDEEAQNKNRPFRGGKNSYDEIKPKIKGFLESRNGRATARATITNHTTNLDEIKVKLLEMGFARANATVATLSDFAISSREVSKVDGEQEFNILASYEKEADQIYSAILERSIAPALQQSPIFRYITQLKTKEKAFHSCGVGRKMVGISITGDVYPCHRFVGEEKFKLGNVNDFDSNSRSFYSKSFIETNPVCSKCWAKYQCGGGGCIQDNEVMMGGVNNVNVRHCTELKHNLKLAIDIFNKLTIEDKEFLFND